MFPKALLCINTVKRLQPQDLQDKKMQVILLYIILLLAINKISNEILICFGKGSGGNVTYPISYTTNVNIVATYNLSQIVTSGAIAITATLQTAYFNATHTFFWLSIGY